MPVFRVMQPQVHEQQYGGGSGGYVPGSFSMPRQFDPQMPYAQQSGVQQAMGPMGPMAPGGAAGMAGGAQNPAMGGGPYVPGTGMPGAGGGGPVDPFNPLQDPTAAIYRGLLNRGINPDIPTPGVSALLKKADDIVRQLAARLGTSGPGSADVLTGPGFQDAIGALLNSALGGGGRGGTGMVLSGPAEGRQIANSLAQLISPQNGQLSEGAQFLAELLDSSKNSTAFLDSLLYGTRAPSVRNALSRPLAGQAIRLQQYEEQPGNLEAITGKSALEMLLSGVLGAGNQPPPGVPGGMGGLGAATGQALPLQRQLGAPGY